MIRLTIPKPRHRTLTSTHRLPMILLSLEPREAARIIFPMISRYAERSVSCGDGADDALVRRLRCGGDHRYQDGLCEKGLRDPVCSAHRNRRPERHLLLQPVLQGVDPEQSVDDVRLGMCTRPNDVGALSNLPAALRRHRLLDSYLLETKVLSY